MYGRACLLYLLTATVLAYNDPRNVWPLPREIDCDRDVFYQLDENSFSFVGSGPGGELNTLTLAFERYRRILFSSAVKRNTNFNKLADGGLQTLLVEVQSTNESLILETDESYSLEVTKTGAQLKAATVYGALRGIETFSQLIIRDSTGALSVTSCRISDKPRFQHRSILVDTSRHYIPVDVLKQHLDAMSYNKFNVFHWHMTDQQSFPYQSYTFPNSSREGAFDQEHIYTQSEVKDLIKFARLRGVRVVPEFDTPGHSASWGKGQPNLLTPCYKANTTTPTGQYGPINPILDSTYTFLESFYKEISEVFPDQYLHLGGDEVSFGCWQSNPDIQKWMAAKNLTDYAKLEEYYEQRLIDIVDKLGKSYIVWQEIFDNGVKIKNDTVVSVWKENGMQSELSRVTAAGHRVVLSACWYLNYISYGPDWPKYYKCDPQDFDGDANQKSLVIGGGVAMWGEYVDATNLISRMWPRASAVGERLWSNQNVTDYGDAKLRLNYHRCRLIQRGIPAEPINGSGYCSPDYDPGYDPDSKH